MKSILKIVLLLIFVLNFGFAQGDLHVNELQITNYSNENIRINVYPDGLVFNGDKKYKLRCLHEFEEVKYIIGAKEYVISSNGGIAQFNHDARDGDNQMAGSIGYGKYRVDFYRSIGGSWTYQNYCYVDFSHSKYPWDGAPNGLQNDVGIAYYSENNIKYWDTQFSGDRTVRIWDQRVRVSTAYEDQDKTGFYSVPNDQYGNWLALPHFPQNYGGLGANLGKLMVNLDIQPGHQPKFECGYISEISNSSTLRLKQNSSSPQTKFYVGHFPNTNYCDAIFNVNSQCTLVTEPYTEFIVEHHCKLTLECNSLINLHNNSKIILNSGSYFCNRGATFSGSGQFIFQGSRIPAGYCGLINPCANRIKDSVKIIIENNSGFEIPDSTTYIFEGSETALICKDSSEIKFGKGSKLVFQDGARINANGCKFVSYDSTEVWDGIYLDGIAYDTLKNCTFQNAVNGINVTDNYNPFGSPGAVEISNCTFKNSTSSDLLNYVYVNNSYNVLIKGCNSEKTGSGGFTAGIIAEYCPTNGVVIADNNINYVTTGISLLQSSEYIGRNTITGSTNSGTGIYLDNSNGTIEYNTVNNFQKSVYGSYSSPYMLKNTLSNAYLKNIDLASNSYPVMKPVVSGSTLRWLGGNNTISGNPSNSGISFADCYPLMDSGYNRITVNGSDYMNGIFTFAYTTVNAKINYWYDNPPQSSLFDISGGNVNYSDPFDGSTLPSTDGTELNSIGWGLYDTVFTKSFGDNSTPEDLFMQAYAEEMSQNYTDAITHYKEVVSSYKTSSYAPVSLSRIFNCLEKSQASSSDYQSIQTYYNSIKSNSVYPNESRELSEDFVIKSKVKQGNVEDAVNDYNAIYQSNQNNSKGLHALLNKLCLENMVQGDNSSNSTNYQNHKMNILSLITGENIRTSSFANINTPKQFRLLQNYPNPFNPVTNIKYEIPKDVNVSIKIYDILGREVFSLNEYKLAGSYEVQFDGTNFASGMYFYKMVVGDNTNNGEIFTDTKKMVLLK